MSLDTSKFHLAFQILDLPTVSGGGGGSIGNPLEIGTDDAAKGALYLYGDGPASTDGGEIRIYNAADHDGSIDYWTLMSNSDELQIGANTGSKTDIIALDYQGAGSYNCNIGTDVTLVVKEGALNVGQNDIRLGLIRAYGNATDGGGTIYLYTGANYDDTTTLYGLRVFEDNFYLGPNNHNQALGMDVNGHIYPGASGTYNLGTASLPYGDIYADDVYVKGSSLHIGDNVVLSETTNDLTINTDVYLSQASNTTFYMPSGSDDVIFKMAGDDGAGNFRILNYTGVDKFRVDSAGQVNFFNWTLWNAAGGLQSSTASDLGVRLGDNAGTYGMKFTGWTGVGFSPEFAAIYSDGSSDWHGNVTVSGYVGWDSVQLSEYNNTDLGINADIYLSKSGGPTFYVASGSDPIVFKLSGNDGPGEFQIQKYDGTKVFDVDSDGYVSTTDWVSFAANFGPRASNGQNMRFLFGDNAGATKISFTDITGGVADSEVASIDSDGNIAASGTIGWDAVQLSEYNNTDFAVNSDLRFSGAAPNIIYGAAANNPTVKIMLGEDTKGGSAHFEVRDYANNLILDINASEVAAGNSTINYRGYLINWDGDTDAHLRQAYPSKDMVFELVGTTGNTQWSFYNTNYGGDVATISADGNADFHGNVTTSGSWESSNFNTPGLNVFVGPTAGANTTTNGIRNTAVGNQALATNTDGDVNVAVGYRTMGFSGGGDFNYNTAVGGYAGFAITTGGDNVFLGAGSGQSVTTASGNIFLGREAGRFEASSNKLYIENSASSSPLIYGEFDNDLVRINGDFDVTGNVTVSGTGDFGGTVTAGGTTPEVQFSATSGTIGVSGNTDLIQLTTSGVVVDGELHVASAATGWFDDGVNFRATVTDGIITNIGTTVSGGYSMA